MGEVVIGRPIRAEGAERGGRGGGCGAADGVVSLLLLQIGIVDLVVVVDAMKGYHRFRHGGQAYQWSSRSSTAAALLRTRQGQKGKRRLRLAGSSGVGGVTAEVL